MLLARRPEHHRRSTHRLTASAMSRGFSPFAVACMARSWEGMGCHGECALEKEGTMMFCMASVTHRVGRYTSS